MMLPTFLPKSPPNYTEEERRILDAILATACAAAPVTVSERMYVALQDYQHWKMRQQFRIAR